MLQFHQGQSDVAFLKASGRTLNITIGPGLPSNTSETMLSVGFEYPLYCVHIRS